MNQDFNVNESVPVVTDDYYDYEGEYLPIEGDIPDGLHGIPALHGIRIFVCAIGVLGNVAVILMILLLTEFKKGITSWYILQLAIADTIFLMTLPFKVVEEKEDSWNFPEWMCKANQSILFINYYCSVTFLTIMAIDRYIAICHSFSERLQKFRTHRAAYIVTVVVWTVCILICTPIMVYSSVRGTQPSCKCTLDFKGLVKEQNFTKICIDEGMDNEELEGCVNLFKSFSTDDACKEPPTMYVSTYTPVGKVEGVSEMGCNYYESHPVFKGLVFFNFIVMFIVPFTIITVCYSLITVHLMKTSFRSDSNSRRSSNAKDNRSRNRVVIMCATLVVVFVVCWLPYHAYQMAMMTGIEQSADFCSKLFKATSLMIYLNSAINPFIYFIVARFKSHFKRAKKSRAASIVISLFSRPTIHNTEVLPTHSNSEKGRQSVKIEEDRLFQNTTRNEDKDATTSQCDKKFDDAYLREDNKNPEILNEKAESISSTKQT